MRFQLAYKHQKENLGNKKHPTVLDLPNSLRQQNLHIDSLRHNQGQQGRALNGPGRHREQNFGSTPSMLWEEDLWQPGLEMGPLVKIPA